MSTCRRCDLEKMYRIAEQRKKELLELKEKEKQRLAIPENKQEEKPKRKKRKQEEIIEIEPVIEIDTKD